MLLLTFLPYIFQLFVSCHLRTPGETVHGIFYHLSAMLHWPSRAHVLVAGESCPGSGSVWRPTEAHRKEQCPGQRRPTRSDGWRSGNGKESDVTGNTGRLIQLVASLQQICVATFCFHWFLSAKIIEMTQAQWVYCQFSVNLGCAPASNVEMILMLCSFLTALFHNLTIGICVSWF